MSIKIKGFPGKALKSEWLKDAINRGYGDEVANAVFQAERSPDRQAEVEVDGKNIVISIQSPEERGPDRQAKVEVDGESIIITI